MNIKVINKDNFYSRLLSGPALSLYNKAVDALSKGNLSVSQEIPDDFDNSTTLHDIGEAIIDGCPELFFIDQEIEMTTYSDRIVMKFGNKYAKSKEGIDHIYEQLMAEIDRIAEKIETYKTDYEKIQRLNKYLCIRVKYVCSKESRYSDAYAALINREARCEGIAKAAKMILDRVGIKSFIASGRARVSNDYEDDHAWNIIYADGIPYQFDFTWNICDTYRKVPGICYNFLTDSDMYLDHFTSYDFPVCSDDSKEFWNVNNGMVRHISDISKSKIVPVGKNFVTAVRFVNEMDRDDVNDCAALWGEDFNPRNYGNAFNFIYRENLQVLMYFFSND